MHWKEEIRGGSLHKKRFLGEIEKYLIMHTTACIPYFLKIAIKEIRKDTWTLTLFNETFPVI